MYPTAPKSDLVETLHGVAVPDPYRWLEDADSAETRAWVDAQNRLTRSFLDGAERTALVSRLTERFNTPRVTSAVRRGRRYFFSFNAGLQPQAVLVVQDGRDGTPRVLIDPNTFSEDGTVALTAIEPSADGTLLAYALSQGGSDRQVLRVRDVATGRDLPDTLEWVKFASIAWLPDGHAFYYLRFPEPGAVAVKDEQYFGRIYRHRLGEPQSADVLVFERPDEKEVVPLIDVTPDGRFAIVTAQRGASDDSEVHVLDPAAPERPPRAIFTGFDAAYHVVGAAGGRLFFRTTKDAPLGRVVAVDPGAPTSTIDEVIPESTDRLFDASIAADAIAVSYLSNASSRLSLFNLSGQPRGAIPLPSIGSVMTIEGGADAADVVITFTSFTNPPRAYVYDAADASLWRLGETMTAGANDSSAPGNYQTRQVWFTSKDGTRVSMFMVERRDVAAGPRPVLLSGYGGFNISRTPAFDPGMLPFLDRGGLFALANLRGGGEYGEAWHRAGMLERKQNVFDDCIAAAEYLIGEGYTTPRQLAIEGGSNGGLLVAAVMLQRPELFGAVICRVPVADMLRYHLFTVGRFWIPEYGSADDPDQFRFLIAYSPYHNVRNADYPPTLVMTADTDDRVAPGMAKKFAARLQADGRGGPFLIRVETKAGHGAGKPVTKMIEEDADILTFLEKTIGLWTGSPPGC
jgi:prolyl oligopeptidase